MNIKLVPSLLLLLFCSTSYAGKTIKVSEKSCTKVDKKISHINSTLRAGYSLKKGEQLKKKLRKLQKQKFACRMKRFATK